MSGYYTIEVLPEPYPQQVKSRQWANIALAATGVVGMALVWVGVSGLAAEHAAHTTYLRAATLDLGASQGASKVAAGVEVDKYGDAALSASVAGTSQYGDWKAGVQRSVEGEVSQTLDLSQEQRGSTFKLAFKKVADAALQWTGGVTHQRSFSSGSDSADATGAGGDPLVLTADVGTTEGDLKITAGVKSTDGDLNLRAGVAGKSDANSWSLGVDSGSVDKPGNWKVNVGLGN